MQLNMYLEQLEPNVIRIKGHRIGLEHIVERYWRGFSPEQIALDFPGVGLPAIYTTLAYYLHHREEVDAYIARIDAEAERRYQEWLHDPNGGQSPLSQRLRALKASRDHQQQQEHHTA